MNDRRKLYDYEPLQVRLQKSFNSFFAGRGVQAASITTPYRLDGRFQPSKIDNYYSLKNKKYHLYRQTSGDNFVYNLVRVGFLGFLERTFFMLGSFSPQRLMNWSASNALKTGTYSIRNIFARLSGTEVFLAQFYLTHCLAATHSQKASGNNKYVEVDYPEYLLRAFGYTLLTFPLQVLRSVHYMQPSVGLNLSSPRVYFSNLFRANYGNLLAAHLHFSVGWTFLIGGMAYFGSQDWGLGTLAIPPLAMMYYLFSVQSGDLFRGALTGSSESLASVLSRNILNTRLGMSLGAVFSFASVLLCYRFAGLRDQKAKFEEFMEENEETYFSDDFVRRTEQFWVTEQHNRNR